MEELAQTVGTAAQSLKNLPDQMQDMIVGVQNQIDQTRQLLSVTSEEQTDQMKKMFGEMLEALKEANQDAVAAQSETAEIVNEKMRHIAAEMQNLLDSAANRMSGHVEQAATQLSGSVQNAEQSVGRILQLLQPQIEAFDKQIANSQQTFTKGHEMLQQMDASIVNVRELIETTQVFSRQLTTGATQLESAGLQLTQASDAFNQENEKYLTASRETTQQIQDALVQSKQLLDDFAQRFQTIDTGLQGIFGEMEKGLNSYAVSTRESINGYLGEFSDQLTQASGALASSVEALSDSVEELADMNEKLINRQEN